MAFAKYKCHKVVEAIYVDIAKIGVRDGEKMVEVYDGTHTVILEASALRVSTIEEVISLAGGYIVRYADGYLSWSPAKAFEEGYSKID